MSETSPITEQANPETELARDRCSPKDLPHDALQTIPRTEPVVQVSEQINAQLENLSVGAGRSQVEEEEEEEDVVNDSGRLVQPDAGGSSSGGLKRIPSMTRGFPFPVSSLKPVGQAFENNRKMIWSWLMDDEISTIGIYGMGGIGKTTMLQHIHDELRRRPDISRHVYWVTVPQDFDIYKLQNLIAKHLDLDLSSEYDILPRAAKLSEELTKKQEWILLLDDLWESFELSAVGIPVPFKGCKVIFTTRSNAICQRMGSQVITKVRPLSEREAWTLFMETLGHGIALSPEVERIAADIARECAGLPLGIITMAGALRGVYDQDMWRNTLKKLKGSKSRDIEDEIFRMLRFSYDRLDDFALQQSLLYCASFPEGHEIEREELIFYLIDGGIIENMWSREAAFEKGHAMLDTLENAGLLERIAGGLAVKMHDLVRDMAIRICKENPSVKEQRRKGIEMVGSNIDPFLNHVEQTNDGILKCKFCGHLFAKGTSLSRIKWHLSGERGHGVTICGQVPTQVQEAAFLSMHRTHKAMVQRRKRIEMAPLKSGWTGAVSAHIQEQNNVDMAQQREPLLTGEFERANDLTRGGIELPRDAPDDQDELKKLKGSKSRDMVDDFKSGLTDAVSASEQEQNNVDMQQEPLLTGELEQANDLTGGGIELPRDTPDDQDELKKLEGSKSRDMVDDFKSGLTGAVSASAQEQNNVEMAQQREPLLTGEFERANDLTATGIERPPDTPDDQDELKKLEGLKSRDMVDDFKSGLTGAVSASEMAQQQEPLLTGEFERENDLTATGIERPPDTPDDQDELKKLKGLKSRDMVDDFKSGLTGAVSASAREQNNVEMAQQRETLLTGEFERAIDLTAVGIERPPDTPDDQDELKKLKGSKSKDMVDDFKSELTGAVSASAREQNNVEMAQQRESLLTGEFERANDLTGAGIELPRDAPDDQDELKKLKGSKSRDMVDDFESGLTGAVSASAREQNNVEMAQQRETLLTGEFERANDLTGEGIELPRDAPDDQDELKKLKGSKSRDMVGELVPMSETIPITEHANPETEFARDHCSPEELPHDEFQTLPRTEPVVQVLEQSNAGLDNLSVDAGRTQVGVQGMEQGGEEGRVCSHLDMENTGEGSAQHVHRIVPPTIDENYNRREATERLVQPSVGASSFGVCGNHNAISTSQQEQNKEVDNVAGDAGTTPAAGIELPRDAPDDQDELKKGSKYRDILDYFKSRWTLLMTSLILEIASAVFGQLGHALVGMVLAFVALLLATAELIHMARKGRMSLPICHRTSTATFVPGKPVGTIVEYFGLVGAVWQCFYSTVEYAYARQNKVNPIKICLLPSIFILCVAISKLMKKSYID